MHLKLIALISILFVFSNEALANRSASVTQGDWMALFSDPTDRYGHAVLGNTPEWGKLCLKGPDSEACVSLPKNRVFEDIKPRLADVDLDGRLDVVVVEADSQAGASLVVYQLSHEGTLTRISNPPIGTAFRWLAPIGIDDLDGDSFVEIAYIDRPHLAKILRIWRFANSTLTEVATTQGLSNHQIGDAFIVGGLRACKDGPIEMITADSSWKNIMASRFDGDEITTRKLRPLTSKEDFETALACH